VRDRYHRDKRTPLARSGSDWLAGCVALPLLRHDREVAMRHGLGTWSGYHGRIRGPGRGASVGVGSGKATPLSSPASTAVSILILLLATPYSGRRWPQQTSMPVFFGQIQLLPWP
jgi:hypothetical protein